MLACAKRTEHTPEKTLMAVYPGCRKWGQHTRELVSAQLETHPDVVRKLALARDETFAAALLGKHERRAIVGSIVRTQFNPGDVAARDVVNAARLDAELAGDLVRGGGAQVQVNVGGDLHALLLAIRERGGDTVGV
jgi:hypothetical protein